MLTKSDISQIRGVVREEVEIVVESVVDKKLQPLHKELKTIKKDIKHLKKTVDIVVKNYDKGDVDLGKRVTKIEHHLSI